MTPDAYPPRGRPPVPPGVPAGSPDRRNRDFVRPAHGNEERWGEPAFTRRDEPLRGGPAAAQPLPGAASGPGGKRAGKDGSMVEAVPYLAVLLVTIAGVYVAWREGSTGGGDGGVVGGCALLGAACVRLLLPARLAGLLATRKRATDVLTLTAFGVGLLVAGLVLPR
jgi:Protein of unknown function (DUF3017)